MIRYTLQCEGDHEFEAWFASGAAYEEQAKRGQISCPLCGTHKVTKGVMAPNIAAGSAAGQSTTQELSAQEAAAALVRKIREHVEKTADNVGDKFAEEARKIHHEEAEPRGIYGSATTDEAKELADEGVEFHPLPTLPEEKN
ncbi:MAG: DUF1178 family protein [Hyphomicrobiales bacterium]|nr:DUF1178 family protein [Hyphomicrobiales bacterium]